MGMFVQRRISLVALGEASELKTQAEPSILIEKHRPRVESAASRTEVIRYGLTGCSLFLSKSLRLNKGM